MAVDYDYLLPSPTLDTGYKASSAHDFLLTTTSLLSNPILTSKEHHSYFMWRRSSAESFTAFSTHGWISAFYSLEYEMRCWHARRLHRTSKRWLWHFIFRDRYGCNYVLGPIYQGHLSALSKRAECLWMVCVIPCMLRLYLRLTLAIQLLLYLHFVPKTTKQALEDVCAVSNQDTDHTYKAVNLLHCC